MNHESRIKEKENCRARSARRSRFHRDSKFVLRDSTLKGFSLVELLVVVAIGTIIALLVINVFPAATRREALDKETAAVLSLLAKARNSTLSGASPGVFGVHFESAKAVLFSGGTYSASSPSNSVEAMNPLVLISGIALADGGSETVFTRLTGQTSESGTVTLSLVGTPPLSKTITIYGTGLAKSN